MKPQRAILLASLGVVVLIGAIYLNLGRNNRSDNLIINSDQMNFPELNNENNFVITSDWKSINDHWQLRIAEIISDDRCPSSGVCETNGNAVIKLQLQQPDVDYTRAHYETVKVPGLNRSPMPNGELKMQMLKPIEVRAEHAVDGDISFQLTPLDLQPYPDRPEFFDQKPALESYELLINIKNIN